MLVLPPSQSWGDSHSSGRPGGGARGEILQGRRRVVGPLMVAVCAACVFVCKSSHASCVMRFLLLYQAVGVNVSNIWSFAVVSV